MSNIEFVLSDEVRERERERDEQRYEVLTFSIFVKRPAILSIEITSAIRSLLSYL